MNEPRPEVDGFDPTADGGMELMLPIHNAMIGTAPAGFKKIRVEMRPSELIKLIGYDPRGLLAVKKGSKVVEPSRHVSQELVELQREVQRSIDADKVAEMVAYLHAAISTGGYADWSELDVVTTAKPDTSRFAEEHKVLLPNAAEYFIIDGQHRFCALIEFVRSYQELAKKFTQAMAISIMGEDRIKEWAGQGFHDKNYLRTVVKATKALAVDHRDPHNVLAKTLHNHELIVKGGGVNEVKDSLAAAASDMVTHAMLYKFVKGFCEGRRALDKGLVSNPNLTEETFKAHEGRLFSYLNELGEILPTWTDAERRPEYLFRSSPAWQALGVVGYLLNSVDDEDERDRMLRKIGEGELDWRRSNLTWESVIGVKQQERDETGKVTKEWVSPRASRQAVDGTIGFLKTRMGLDQDPDQIV